MAKLGREVQWEERTSFFLIVTVWQDFHCQGAEGHMWPFLTLIRAAGGVYDFWNFEEVYLCNGSSSDLQNSCIPRKTSCEYILLNTLERKTAFLAIYRPNRAQNCPFFRRFSLFRTAVKVYMTSLPPPLDQALSPPIVGVPSSSGAACTVSISF